MRQETAALRDFSPLHVRFGSIASVLIRPVVDPCPLYPQKRTSDLTALHRALTATATLVPSKGRLIRCTVSGFTPNRLAMTRTPGLPGVARASRIRFSSAGAIGSPPKAFTLTP